MDDRCSDFLVVKESEQVPFVLLDHNHFAVEDFNPDHVVIKSIIDHHVDENLYPDASPRIIRPCGSCTSLVVEYFIELWTKNQIPGETQLTRMALSTVFSQTQA